MFSAPKYVGSISWLDPKLRIMIVGDPLRNLAEFAASGKYSESEGKAAWLLLVEDEDVQKLYEVVDSYDYQVQHEAVFHICIALPSAEERIAVVKFARDKVLSAPSTPGISFELKVEIPKTPDE